MYTILVIEHEVNETVWEPRGILEYNIRLDFKTIWCERVKGIKMYVTGFHVGEMVCHVVLGRDACRSFGLRSGPLESFFMNIRVV
jgi:hypothetical protein